MLRFQIIFVVFVISGMVFAIEDENRSGHGGGGHSSGGQSGGGHSGGRKNCSVVATGTTSCAGAASLGGCKNTTFITELAAGGATTALVCRGVSPTPVSSTIELEVEFNSRRSTCFLAPTAETRTCADLNSDATFTKAATNNQAALLTALGLGPTIRVCCVSRSGTVTDLGARTIHAEL